MNPPITPTAEIWTITPETAAELLDKNPINRKFTGNNPKYKTVLRAMRQDEWELNGEAIKLNTEGLILDGQHRLHAIIESGVTIKSFVISGLPTSTQDTMDTGKPRSVADTLHMMGIPSSTNTAAIVRRVHLYWQQGLRAGTYGGAPATNREILATFNQNPWLQDLVTPSRNLTTYAKIPGSLAGLLIVVFDEIDAEDAAFFWERLMSGASLAEKSPILALKNTLLRNHEATGAITPTHTAALVIKAWNKFRAGEQASRITFTPGGANPERFPDPR